MYAPRASRHRLRALSREALPVAAIKQGDALSPEALRGACEGAEVVFSCLGASLSLSLGKGWRSFSSVDTPANLNLLAAARAARVRRFVYVSFSGAQELLHLDYSRAHERVVEALARSGLSYAVLRPVGFFSALGELQELARRGFVPEIGDGRSRTNPIHDADLAEACAEAIEAEESGVERPLGGPEILTRRQISELAFEGLGRPPKVLRIPPRLMKLNALLLRPLHPRLSHAISFFATIATREAVVPAYGARTLREFFRERAQRG